MVARCFALLLLLVLSCRTGGSPIYDPRYPALVPSRPPDEARTYAQSIEDSERAAEVAWLMGNDRALARTRLNQALARPAPPPSVHLLRGLIDMTELDRRSATQALTTILRTAPTSSEAHVAMVILYDWSVETHIDPAPIADALQASGLLGDRDVPPAHRALATAIAIRLDAIRGDLEAAKQHRATGGWLSQFVSHGPVAPMGDAAFADPPRTFRGLKPPKRYVAAKWRRIPVTTGDIAGGYVLSGCFELGARARETPVVIESHLPAAGQVEVDGLMIVDRPGTSVRGRTLQRRSMRLAPGWHCVKINIRAHSRARPSISVLGADGRPIVLREATDQRPVASVPSVGQVKATADAASLIERLTFDADRALYGRVLGAIVLLSHWINDVEAARELLDGTELAAPRSAAVHLARARLMTWTNLPETLAETTIKAALEADPSCPAGLLALARLSLKDDLEGTEALLETLENVAPDAAGAKALAFRLAKQRGWHAQAADALERALALEETPELLLDGAQFYRGLDRVAQAQALETRAEALPSIRAPSIRSQNAAARGDLDQAIEALREAARQSDDGAGYVARIGGIELARGRLPAAAQAFDRALKMDPLESQALRGRLILQLALKDRKAAQETVEQLQRLGESSIRSEAAVARLSGSELGLFEDEWLRGALEFDVMPFIKRVGGSGAPRGLDPGDRWSRHHSVLVLDRVVDFVRPDGHALSLRHAVTRLQTKEATDRAGEINLPAEALPLSLTTIKPDGRRFEVDRHAGKEDLSFSGLAPGDAVERKWLAIDEPATAWGGYLRRFYFKSTSPILRSDLTVVVPKGAKVWTRSYNGAPLPTKREGEQGTVYHWTASEIDALTPEPHSVPYEEYVPFVVVAVDVDRHVAMQANVLGLPGAARISFDVRRKAEALVAGVDDPVERVRRIFAWVTSEIGLGGTKNVDIVLASRRGERSGLFTALCRAAGFTADIALVKPGTSAQLPQRYPNPSEFNIRFVRVSLPQGRVLWVRVDSETPWLGKLPPAMKDGQYVLGVTPDRLRAIPVRDEEVERWPLSSKIEMTVDPDGTAKGRVTMALPGTFGAEIRDFLQRARKDEVTRHFQGWIGAVIPGARLLAVDSKGDGPLQTVMLEADILVGHFMVRDGDVLVAEQLFDSPLAHESLGLPTLASYLRAPNRKTPLLLTELSETMEVVIRLPKGGAPIETPQSFHRSSAWGAFAQGFEWDPEAREARLFSQHATKGIRLDVDAFPGFRDLAEEILQSSRNRLVVPIVRDEKASK